MGGGIGHLVLSGPLILAVPVAAAAGAVTFLSPCVLPLVPGYLSYVAGMSGVDAQAPRAGEAAVRRTARRETAQPGRGGQPDRGRQLGGGGRPGGGRRRPSRAATAAAERR